LGRISLDFPSSGFDFRSPGLDFPSIGFRFSVPRLATEAKKRWNAALTLKSDYAETYSNVSNLLIDEGDDDGAEGMAQRAIALKDLDRLEEALDGPNARCSRRRRLLSSTTARV
jgi:hypothetical protein